MSDVMEFVQNEDGTFSAYDNTYDVVIHCKSEDEQKKVIERLSTDWIPVSERLPEKSTIENDMTDYQCGMVDGRNQCIDEITGGTI